MSLLHYTAAAEVARTLITGATGFIGSYVCRLLVQRGDDVRATLHPGAREQLPARLDVESVRADIVDRRAIRRAMSGVERVFHLAGTSSLALPREQVFALNVEGARIVFEEALRAEVQRVVHTSSVAAIGPAPAGKTADESSVWDAGRYAIPYVDSKREAEAAGMRLLARGLPLVIVNPALVLGAGDPGAVLDDPCAQVSAARDPGIRGRDAQRRGRRGRGARSPPG